MQIRTPEGYLSYPNLKTPKSNPMDPTKPPRYSMDLVFPKGTDLTELQEAIVKIAKETGIAPQNSHLCLKKCETQIDKETGHIKNIYDKGDYFLKTWCNETHPPQLIGPQKQPNYNPLDFKAGNLASAIVNLYGGAVPSKYVNASMMAVQWRGEGVSLAPKANLNLFDDAGVDDIATPEGDPPANLFG